MGKIKMVACKKCGKAFMNKEAEKGHICDKIEPGKAKIKRRDIKENG